MMMRKIIMGRLGHDPKITYTKKGDAICEFSLAINEGEKTTWEQINVWFEKGVEAYTYLKKGDLIFVFGEEVTRKFKDKSGEEKMVKEILAIQLGYSKPVYTPPSQEECDGEEEVEFTPYYEDKLIDEMPF
jgi:single-strand DNA-binding protein